MIKQNFVSLISKSQHLDNKSVNSRAIYKLQQIYIKLRQPPSQSSQLMGNPE